MPSMPRNPCLKIVDFLGLAACKSESPPGESVRSPAKHPAWGRSMLGRCAIVLLLLPFSVPPLRGAEKETITDLVRQLKAVAKQGAGSPAARAAWDRLAEKGPAALPDILDAMDTDDTAVANWLRTAFDHIVDQAMKDDGKAIDRRALRAFVADPKKPGRARRLALEVV